MDIRITEKSLRNYLTTNSNIEQIIDQLCLCGPTVDRFHKTEDDLVLEIEAITNRIDTASVIGVAREANTILRQNKLSSELNNDPYKKTINLYPDLPSRIKIEVQREDLVERFLAVEIEGVSVQSSSTETVKFLENCGQRGINNLVDITNEVTITHGLPSHIFDRDKLAMQNLQIRLSKSDETITTLDGDKITLSSEDIIIQDASGKIVDLCCVMGGEVSKVDEHTKNLLVIIPICNPKLIRKTSLKYQKRTVAAQIFEKGPDLELALPTLDHLIKLITERAGGHVASRIFDFCPNPRPIKKVSIDLDWLSKFAGVTIPTAEILEILNNLGFKNSTTNSKILTTEVPSFRYKDISIQEDLAEEIIRIYGYYKIKPVLPPLSTPPQPVSPIFELERKITRFLSARGFHEVYNSSLISLEIINQINSDPTHYLSLSNPLSSDYEYLRNSLLPSAIINHKNNLGNRRQDSKFFEIANIYIKTPDSSLPEERSTLIISSQNLQEIKEAIDFLSITLNQNLSFSQEAKTKNSTLVENNQVDIVNDHKVGYYGQVKNSILNKMGVNIAIYVAEIDLEGLTKAKSAKTIYRPISEYPEISEDITINSNLGIGSLIEEIKMASPLISSVKYIDSFENNHTFKILLNSMTKNLTKEESEEVKDKIRGLFN